MIISWCTHMLASPLLTAQANKTRNGVASCSLVKCRSGGVVRHIYLERNGPELGMRKKKGCTQHEEGRQELLGDYFLDARLVSRVARRRNAEVTCSTSHKKMGSLRIAARIDEMFNTGFMQGRLGQALRRAMAEGRHQIRLHCASASAWPTPSSLGPSLSLSLQHHRLSNLPSTERLEK